MGSSYQKISRKIALQYAKTQKSERTVRSHQVEPPQELQKFQLWLDAKFPRQEFTIEYRVGHIAVYFSVVAGSEDFMVYEAGYEHVVRWYDRGVEVEKIFGRKDLPGLRELKSTTEQVIDDNPELYVRFESLLPG